MTDLEFFLLWGAIGIVIVTIGAWLDRRENRRRRHRS
jgi:hypothetical protein